MPERTPAALTRAQVRAFDRRAIEELGLPALVLMENAGRGAADVLRGLGVRGRVIVCCGKGNNGGDGLVLARHLLNEGADVHVWLFADPAGLSPECTAHWHVTRRLPLPTRIWDGAVPEELDLADAEWIVDALFGTGLAGPVRAPLDRVIACINAAPGRVFALDIPSGLDADVGEPLGATVRADHTATFVAPKVGYANPAAAAWLGQVHVVGIGVAPRFLAS